MKRLLAAGLLLAFAVPALAQQQPVKLDPRLAEPALNVVQAQAAYLSAQVRIAQQDLAAEHDRRTLLEDWVREYFGIPPLEVGHNAAGIYQN